MAAAEYYSHMPAGHGQQAPSRPPQAPPYLSPQPSYVYPQTPPTSNPQPQPQQPHAPPPYSVEMPAEKPLRPTDQQFQRNSFSHPQRPPPPSWNYPHYQPTPPVQKQDHQPFPPQGPQLYPQYPPQPFYQNPPPHLRPYQANHSTPNLVQGYSSDPEPHRRRRSRNKSKSRSTTTDGFLGAAGGGLIGDMIFPGLGTLGGAVAGYFGGKDYGKHRKQRESVHREVQRDWEIRHGKRGHSHERRYS